MKKLREIFFKKEVFEERIEGEGPLCHWCDGTIESNETLKSFNKKKFHIQCYRIMIKEAKKEFGFK